jgi:uncharacterized protein
MAGTDAMKLFLNIVGCLAVALAILGIFLPLLPTTPFLLLASACFVRGSDRMHRWLLTNRVFGEFLRNYENDKGIPRRAKIIAIALLWTSLIFSIYKFDGIWIRTGLMAIGIGVSLVLLRMKTMESGCTTVRD